MFFLKKPASVQSSPLSSQKAWVQKRAYRNLLNIVHPSTLRSTLVTRIGNLIDPYVVDSVALLRNIEDTIVSVEANS